MLMGKQIKKVYIIHHSHTDIGYTDLQEQVIYNQIHNIKKVITLLKRGYEKNSGGTVKRTTVWNSF